MPFDLKAINQNTDYTDLLVITFSKEDFSDQTQLENLKTALFPFKKLRVKLDPNVNNKEGKELFLQFMKTLLTSKPKVKELDLSHNQFSADNLLSIFEVYKQYDANHEQFTKLNLAGNLVVPKNVPGTPNPTGRLTKNQAPSFLQKIMTNLALDELILSNNQLFADHQTTSDEVVASLKNARKERKHKIKKIDISNNHPQGGVFAISQLFSLVENRESTCAIFVSKSALPPELQESNEVRQCMDDVIDLQNIADIVISTHKKQCFEQKMKEIQSGKLPGNSLGFAANLFEALTDEQTPILAKALTGSAGITALTLPPCNLSHLVNTLQTNTSIVELDFSKLGSGDDFLNSLSQIVSRNSTVRRLKLDYRAGTTDGFQRVLAKIIANETSQLKTVVPLNRDNQIYIELIDSDGNLKHSPRILLELLEKLKKFPQITIVIDINALNPSIHQELAANKLVTHQTDSILTAYTYEPDEEKKREAPLFYHAKGTKFALTPRYDTYQPIVNCVKKYVENLPEANKTGLEEELPNADSDQDIEQIEVTTTTTTTLATTTTTTTSTANTITASSTVSNTKTAEKKQQDKASENSTGPSTYYAVGGIIDVIESITWDEYGNYYETLPSDFLNRALYKNIFRKEGKINYSDIDTIYLFKNKEDALILSELFKKSDGINFLHRAPTFEVTISDDNKFGFEEKTLNEILNSKEMYALQPINYLQSRNRVLLRDKENRIINHCQISKPENLKTFKTNTTIKSVHLTGYNDLGGEKLHLRTMLQRANRKPFDGWMILVLALTFWSVVIPIAYGIYRYWDKETANDKLRRSVDYHSYSPLLTAHDKAKLEFRGYQFPNLSLDHAHNQANTSITNNPKNPEVNQFAYTKIYHPPAQTIKPLQEPTNNSLQTPSQ